MSERYGVCRRCNGSGKVVDPAFLKTLEETGQKLSDVPPGLVRWEECSRCGGTGHSGDIQDYRD